ncbi:MAG: hypothetical protein WCS65_09320 [Verrucomicrobiae bacterium]
MKNEGIRWIQRFQNCQRALSQLSEPVALSGQGDLLDHIRRVGVVFYEKKALLALQPEIGAGIPSR